MMSARTPRASSSPASCSKTLPTDASARQRSRQISASVRRSSAVAAAASSVKRARRSSLGPSSASSSLTGSEDEDDVHGGGVGERAGVAQRPAIGGATVGRALAVLGAGARAERSAHDDDRAEQLGHLGLARLHAPRLHAAERERSQKREVLPRLHDQRRAPVAELVARH